MKKLKRFEWGIDLEVNNRADLETYLYKIWQRQNDDLNDVASETDNETDTQFQGFLSFDGNKARTRNFVGFIQSGDLHLEIYPKVFGGLGLSAKEPKLMLRHLFFWFDYCRKWKFPFSDTDIDSLDDMDLPELIINLIAGQIMRVVTDSPISLYQEIEETLLQPKGRINFNRYINQGVANGNFHHLECDHEPLVYDNSLNRAIKYTTRILQNLCRYSETYSKLEEILFVLDDVTDCTCSSSDLDMIRLNAFFIDYHQIISLCKMVLEQQVYSNDHAEMSQWSLLLPMEYIFEDFIAGFMESHFSDKWKVHYQKSEMYLASDPKAFQMQHDIFLTSIKNPEIRIIIDTKYKLRGDFKSDKKKGISQNDLYQMTSYAYRRGCENVILLFPNQQNDIVEYDLFTICSGFNTLNKIKVLAAEIPFWTTGQCDGITDKLKIELTKILNHYNA